MEMPVVVGILMAMMFLISFSEWFYSMIKGLRELVLDDVYFGYRIALTSVVSIVFMVGVFWGIATVNECKQEEKEGIFASLRCEEYLNLRASTKSFFKLGETGIDESFN